MTPVKPNQFQYAFSPKNLVSLRNKLNLTQASLAEILDVPVNTISRWENGNSTPDAHTLAALYSIAKARDMEPEFFIKREGKAKTEKQRTKLILSWDFENVVLEAKSVDTEWYYMKAYLDLLYPKTRSSRFLYAYMNLFAGQQQAAEVLKGLKFTVNQGSYNADTQLIQYSLSECEKNPHKTVFILVAKDRDYTEFLERLRGMGVDVYIWAPDECSQRLRQSVGVDHFIYWDAPYVVTQCIEVIKNIDGEPITRSHFGTLCKDKLKEDEIYPDDAGFSRKNPYGSVLGWLQRQGIVCVNTIDVKSGTILITIAK